MAWRRPSAAKATYNGIGPDDERRRVTADRTALRNRRSAVRLAYTATGGRVGERVGTTVKYDIYALK